MNFHILIFWCQMNYADSARIATVLKNIWRKQTNLENANIVIFDTCSVRQKSEDKITWKLKEIPKNKKIWITWCMVQHNFKKNRLENTNLSKQWKTRFKSGNFIQDIKQLSDENIPFIINKVYQPIWTTLKKKFPNLELMFRIDDVHLLPKIIKFLWYKINENTVKQLTTYLDILPEVANQTENSQINTAYVPISTGCNQFCSYCIVPFARWLERHRNTDDIIKEIKYWVNKWKEEIVLLWQIVNKHPDFTKILKETLKIQNLKWLRYTSPYPTFYNDEIFSLHENEEKLCPHIHIPVQSGSNKILKLMNRWYTVEQFKTFIDKIRNLKRNISITSDVIVWFSNETEEDFQQTLDLIKYSKFDMIYVGIYSPRPNTLAYKNLEDNINKEIKQKRWEKVNNLLYKISEQNNKKEIWKTRQAIIVWKKKDKNWKKIYYWYTDNFKNIELKKFSIDNTGEIISVKIIDSIPLKLFGKYIS